MQHGDPDGLLVIDQPNWSGIGIAFPRAAYKEVSKRPEFSRTGVYILVGPGPEGSALPSLYIGQSDNVKSRLDSHHREYDFWEWVVFFVSKDNALNVAAAQHIESRLIERAREAKRSHPENGNRASGPNLGEADVAEAEGFLRMVLRIFPLLGLSAFKPEPGKAEPPDNTLLQITAKGVSATGYPRPGGFIVREGSTAVGTDVVSNHPYTATIRKLRDDLMEQGVLEPAEDFYRFTRDYDLNSPSTAAGVVLGRAANGRTEWRDASGTTLKQLQEEEADG